MTLAIEVRSLHKSFGSLQAVQGASFSVETGEVFSLLGPNGAGKSTTISMLSGLLAPTQGDAFIMGHSVVKEAESAKACLGVVPQDIALYPDLSARENLDFWGKMYGLRGAALKTRVDEVLEIIGLVERQKDHVAKFSGLKPLDDVTAFAATIDAAADTMLVGHLPFMERMAAYLVTGSADKPVFKFQNSGIVCLERDPDSGSWVIVWTLMPKIG